MHIEYIGHNCFWLEAGALKIVFDPWFAGPIYADQWHQHPRAIDTSKLAGANVIAVSHGHEDHFHEASLLTFPRSARVFFPFLIYGGAKEYLVSLGFERVTEALSSRTYQLDRHTRLTYVTNSLDSMIVVEHGDQVILNLNDALYGYPKELQDLYIGYLQRRWRKFDVMICSTGVSGFFPNNFRTSEKDDVGIAELREQFLAAKVCFLIDRLRPRIAIPCGSDFRLLQPELRWVNQTRFPRERLAEYFELVRGRPFDGQILAMKPGDTITNGEFRRGSNSTAGTEDQPEPAVRPHIEAAAFAERLAQHAQVRLTQFPWARDELAAARVGFRLVDSSEDPTFDLRTIDGVVQVRPVPVPAEDLDILVESRYHIVENLLVNEWGGDAVTVGSGAVIHIRNRATVDSGLHDLVMDWLFGLPDIGRFTREHPLRTGLCWLLDPGLRTRLLGRRLRAEADDKCPKDLPTREWLTRSPADLRAELNLPGLPSRPLEELSVGGPR